MTADQSEQVIQKQHWKQDHKIMCLRDHEPDL